MMPSPIGPIPQTPQHQGNQLLPGYGGGYGGGGGVPGMGPGSGGYGSDPQNAQDQLNQMLPGWGGGMGQPQQQWAPPNLTPGNQGPNSVPRPPGTMPGPWQGDYQPQQQQAQPVSMAPPGSQVSQGITPPPGTYPGQDGQTNRISGTGGPVAKGAAPGSNAYGWYR